MSTFKTEWISVTERLPENTGPKLISRLYGNRQIGYYLPENKHWIVGHPIPQVDTTVSHWMELPLPPKP